MDIDDMWDDEEDTAQFCKPKRNIPSGTIAQAFPTHPDFGRIIDPCADLHDETKAQLAKAVDALRVIRAGYSERIEAGAIARAVLAEIEKGGV